MNFLRFYFYTIVLHLTLAGSSFVQIGDAVSVKLDSSAGFTHTDNLFRDNSNKQSDDFYTITPGLDISYGQPNAGLDLNFGLSYDIVRYSEFDALDVELLRYNISGKMNQLSSFGTNFTFSRAESQSPRSTFDVAGNPDLIETTQSNYSITTEYRYSPKFSVGLGLKWSELDFDTFSDEIAGKDSFNLPLDLIYRYSEKLDVVYGITYINRDVGARTASNSDGYETESYFYNVGLRGELLPKLSGKFSVGYRTLEFSNNNSDRDSLGLNSSLTWAISPKIQSMIGIEKGFDAAGSGDTHEITKLNISNAFSINTEFSAGLNVSFSEKDFRSRTDEVHNFSLTLSYTPSNNNHFTFGFYDTESKSVVDYDVEEFRIRADFRY